MRAIHDRTRTKPQVYGEKARYVLGVQARIGDAVAPTSLRLLIIEDSVDAAESVAHDGHDGRAIQQPTSPTPGEVSP